MASALAIISKAVFEKTFGKSITSGAVLAVDRYRSSHAAFEQVGADDAIFLVTVRPPDESLWLIGILEAPRRKGDSWVADSNEAPARDVTAAIPKLVFASGSGLKAKKGALGMSLQTPRILTDSDVKLLRGGGWGTAAAAYRTAVDQVPAAAKARADAAAAAAEEGEGSAILRFSNYRRPFEMLAKLGPAQKRQLQRMADNNEAGKIAKLVNDEEWSAMELVDVMDIASGKIEYQLYAWPYGAGELFEHDTTTSVAMVIQHAYQCTVGDLPLRKALAAAYATAQPPLAELFDFRLDYEAQPPPPEVASYEAVLEELKRELGTNPDQIRVWSDLDHSAQALVRRHLATRTKDAWGLFELGIPEAPALQRWMHVDAPGAFEKLVDGVPVLRHIENAMGAGTIAVERVDAIAREVTADELADSIFVAVNNDPYYLFARAQPYTLGQTHGHTYVLRLIRLLARLVDATGDDAAIAFAKRATDHLAKQATFWLAAIATVAVAMRAKRRGEQFPDTWFELVLQADFLGAGLHLRFCDGYRDVIEVLSEARRDRLVDELGFGTTTNDDFKNKKKAKTPVLTGAWLFVDLVPTERTLRKMADSLSAWNRSGEPKTEALAVIAKLGARCAPFLAEALERYPETKLLKEALKVVSPKR